MGYRLECKSLDGKKQWCGGKLFGYKFEYYDPEYNDIDSPSLDYLFDKEYLDRTYGVLYWFITKNIDYYNAVSEDKFRMILSNVRNGHHYRTVEKFTVDQFIKNIESYKEYAEKMGDPYILD